MKNTIKKYLRFNFNYNKETEHELEKLAAQGLFLEKIGIFFCTFQKGKPKSLKYAITYFSEASIYKPYITDNQQTYIDYAQAAGWNFVLQMDRMQLFCSDGASPIPFETDEKEKFENIKKCKKKSYFSLNIFSMISSIVLLIMMGVMLKTNPINFLSSQLCLFMLLAYFFSFMNEVCSLFFYLNWCKRSEASIANNGECAETATMAKKIVDDVFFCFTIGCIGSLFCLAFDVSSFGIFIAFALISLLIIVLRKSIKYFKKQKAFKATNKVLLSAFLIMAEIAFLALIISYIIHSAFPLERESDYRIVNWEMSETYTTEYELHSHTIPLTCEDLYGEIDYDYYNSEIQIDSTVFLIKTNYRQEALPEDGAPPSIEYTIIEPQFDFAYSIAKEELLEIPDWAPSQSCKSIDNNIFNTTEAYQQYYSDSPTGFYILFYEDKIVTLEMEEPLITEQISIVKEKLEL